jgi:tripartite-type tricarboxylate transporter receptor subunit TctC
MRFPPRLFNRIVPALTWAALLSITAGAQPWPSKPITLVIAFAPGSIMDTVGRAISRDLSNVLGQPVVVENKSGGGGVAASVSVARAPPDGYTLLMTTIGPAVLRPLIDGKLAYDAVADFVPIVLVGDVPNILAANPKLGFDSVRDLVAYAKRSPGRFSMAHAGPGTMGHLLDVLFATEAGIDGNLVSYRGAAPMMLDLASGQVDFGFPAYGPEAAVTRILAVATDERVEFLPGVPTMSESNFPGVIGSTWYAIFAPTGLAPEIVSKFNTSINAFLNREETRRLLASFGFRILGGAPQRLRDRMVDDRGKWSKVINANNIHVDQ